MQTAEQGKNAGERVELPKAFRERMKELLGEDYEAFMESYERDRVQGLRFNPLKCDVDQTAETLAATFGLAKIPWCAQGWYYDAACRPGRHPLHEAGAYYIQEPSAMAVTELLDPQPGERILDLCAAPGGKTTHIAGRMRGQGILISNEIHPARAKILSQNVERIGAKNVVVTNAEPAGLTPYFRGYFDRIVVDAPCSGEGMFRKDEQARAQWSEDNVKLCAARQQDILDEAVKMLRPGGCIVYSTCTFSPEEDEGTLEIFLRKYPEFELEQMRLWDGFSEGRPEWIMDGRPELARAVRIWPHKVEGEGHFLARLRRAGDCLYRAEEMSARKKPEHVQGGGRKEAGGRASNRRKQPEMHPDKKLDAMVEELLRDVLKDGTTAAYPGRLVAFGEQIYLLPEEMPEYAGLRILRAGLHLGTCKKNRIEPAHALALALKPEQAKRVWRMEPEGMEAKRYLAGEALPVQMDNGWVLMCVGDFSAGWAKENGGILKNHYPKGLRRA